MVLLFSVTVPKPYSVLHVRKTVIQLAEKFLVHIGGPELYF